MRWLQVSRWVESAAAGSTHVLILGGGYVGSLLARMCAARGLRTTVTRRPASLSTLGLPPSPEGRFVAFDASDASTWENIPRDASHVVWTFPAGAGSLAFREDRLAGAAVLVYSSTSCYLVTAPEEVREVDEGAPLDPSSERFAAEEALRESGATVFALSGLFGPGRDPASWLRQGRIRNSDAFVNLVHRFDVARASLCWIEEPASRERFNVSTQCHRWGDLAECYVNARRIAPEAVPPSLGVPPESKRVVVRKLLAHYPSLARQAFLDARDEASLTAEQEGHPH